MNLPRFLNYAAYIGVFLSYWLSGYAASVIAEGIYRPILYRALHSPSPYIPSLPGITNLILVLDKQCNFTLTGFVMGVVFSGLLFFLDYGDTKRKIYIPACMAFVLLTEWFFLLIVFWGTTLTFIPDIGKLSP
ncbi:MAG: hypothetical protein LV481_10770 [Methylacidiphilales bacterium]|nr:hypothetical protein [Candidatus Methylacidiphilales bacterium]